MSPWKMTNTGMPSDPGYAGVPHRTVSAQALPLHVMISAMMLVCSVIAHEPGRDIKYVSATGCYPEGQEDLVWDVVLDFGDDAASCERVARLLGAET
jgi:hypothetical protein